MWGEDVKGKRGMEAKERRDEPRRKHEGHDGGSAALCFSRGPQRPEGTAPAENPRESSRRMEPKGPSILLSRHAPRFIISSH